MLDLLGKELPISVLQTLLGSLLTALLFLANKGWQTARTWNVRRFWRPFMRKAVSLVITEYPPEKNERATKLARLLGNRWLMSKGMALSMAHLLEFCSERITSRRNIGIFGAKSSGQMADADNIIVLGSAAVNPFARSMLSRLDELYELPFQIVWDDQAVCKEILAPALRLTPELKEGFGHDYGLVIKARHQTTPERWVLLIAGCHMWGTEAAVKAVTNAAIINAVARKSGVSENVAFVVKARVANNNTSAPELEIHNSVFVEVLKPKAPLGQGGA